MIDQCRQAFMEESDELLAELETTLLELDQDPLDRELIDRIFRALHTIKGSSAMFGYSGVADFSHELETLFALVRDGDIGVNRELVALTLKGRDLLKEMLSLPADSSGLEERARLLEESFRIFLPAKTEPGPQASCSDAAAGTGKETFLIRYAAGVDTFRCGTNPVNLFNELRELGECRVRALTDAIPGLHELDPTSCHLSWEIELATGSGEDAIRDVFIFADEDEVEIVQIKTAMNGETSGELIQDSKEPVTGTVARSENEGTVYEAISSLRVSADKLDTLVNLVGELVTVQARLTQTAVSRDDSELLAIAEEVERLTGDLRDNTLSIRMLPIASTFSRLRRLVHDLAGELGKEIDLVTEGGETELDKTVIEKLADPLVHLIRNSIDHGIESPEVREAGGKSRLGRLRLTAVHSGDSVQISISDDGIGIDREVVRKRAMERGLVHAGTELNDTELLNLIFIPGLSTSTTVTNVSGRGVGMDVVRKGVDQLRGSITVASSRGAGTTFTLRIPLTLAIIESLLVRIGKNCFVLPLSLVEECIELTKADIDRANGRHLVNVRGTIVPYIPLRQRFGVTDKAPDRAQVVITRVDGKRVGLVVDQVIGEHQTVIKPLGRLFRDVAGLSGATILGDGTVALILDVPQVVHGEEGKQAEG